MNRTINEIIHAQISAFFMDGKDPFPASLAIVGADHMIQSFHE